MYLYKLKIKDTYKKYKPTIYSMGLLTLGTLTGMLIGFKLWH